jgi:hypothetical protein
MRDSLIRVIYLRCGGKLRRSGRPPFFPWQTDCAPGPGQKGATIPEGEQLKLLQWVSCLNV